MSHHEAIENHLEPLRGYWRLLGTITGYWRLIRTVTDYVEAVKNHHGANRVTSVQNRHGASTMLLKVLSDENQGGSKVVSIASSFFTV